MLKTEREALEELVASRGWELFSSLVRTQFNSENTVQRIFREMTAATDMVAFAHQTVALVTAQDTAEKLLRLPYDFLEGEDNKEEE